jgi:YgiT-type zinc finger domain-containing protein
MHVEHIDKVFVVGNRRRLIKNLTAHVCGTCGERFFDARVATTVEKTMGLARVRTRPRAA